MAASYSLLIYILIHFLYIHSPQFCTYTSAVDDFPADISLFHGDYSPPSPPPSLPPLPPPLSCQDGLNGTGSLKTSCELNYDLNFTNNIYIYGEGNLIIHPGVKLSCPRLGCEVTVNVSGEFKLGLGSVMIAGSVHIVAENVSLLNGSVVNVTALAGSPPDHTSGRPDGAQGAGGGYGGRGASCVMDNDKLPSDVWGGDPYGWESLAKPGCFGSKGGTTVKDEDYGGEGGGRIRVEVKNVFDFQGSLLADGGDGGVKGGGGSGGSIYIVAHDMTGYGRVSASGGNGFSGGSGGRVSVDIFSVRDDPIFLFHGGHSYGCSGNSGAAGTFYDTRPRKLTVSNHNLSTETDTLLMEFPYQPLLTNVYIENCARAAAPLLWSRMQVRGQLSVSCGAVLSFGLPHYALSEYELIAEEVLISDSIIKVYGALRMSVKVYLMWNSQMLIDGDGDAIAATSMLEASNLVVLRGSSLIQSNANLGLHGQGTLNLSGPGDVVEAQRLVLSLFYNINVGPGSTLRGPLKNASNNSSTSLLYCEREDCPIELIHPPEDCNVNSSLPFTVQICRVEDVNVEGLIEGSVVHFHWVRTVNVETSGAISATGLGCVAGVGSGRLLSNGFGGGGGHGGKGGDGYYNGSVVQGGITYGNADFPCELGSGSGNSSLPDSTAGGGIIVMGSLEHSLSSLYIDGSLRADGESYGETFVNGRGMQTSVLGNGGGGSGGTILLFLNSIVLGDSSTISTYGGHGSVDGGGGGGGRVHFHWADITVGDEYLPVASGEGTINVRGGSGKGLGYGGENGSLSGKSCPKGLFGIFCQECPRGTFKNVTGSDKAHCLECPSNELPHRAKYVAVRGGVADTPCPYKCISERYRMPHCYTALEELMYTFGGPWLFGFILLSLLILLGIVLSVARMKFVSGDDLPSLVQATRGLQIDRSFPFLESLNEVLETNRAEESQSHVHRMFFMGSNSFSEPWHLPYSPPQQVAQIVYEDAFNRFVDEINSLAAYQWWEGSMYSIISIFAYPLAWSWLQWRRKKKIHTLREYVRSEYDHSCLRSCRSRALYEGLKVATTSDLMLAYVDFFLGGDEKRNDLPPRLNQRLPLSLVFGGDGSYMTPFALHSDNILTSLISQSIPSTIWYRLVAGLNAQLRLVRLGHLNKTFRPVIGWLETYANPTLSRHGVRVDLSCFQPTTSGYCQFGLVMRASENETAPSVGRPDMSSSPERQSRFLNSHPNNSTNQLGVGKPLLVQKKMIGGTIHAKNLEMVKEKKTMGYPFSFVLYNTKPVAHQDLVGLVISVMLLADFSLVLLMLLQLYSSSLLHFFLVLSILPLGIILPFPAGLNALFSYGPKRSSGPARVYALWNITSLINVVVAFICGIFHYNTQLSPSNILPNMQSFSLSMDDGSWWLLPCVLVLCKFIQARVIDYHVANLEIKDRTLYSTNPHDFWQTYHT
ncbi:Protein diaphanous 1 like [Heracleum sosnowskyi]|uniref:Protein diaphanous 1 like n=1 Tax=Heracleum sosnowskyi TaxID=360622 RepID=A0AAD8MAV3_9APIA|nr:Protein diaphanous 1 like [Heracleum sosnowskyi]